LERATNEDTKLTSSGKTEKESNCRVNLTRGGGNTKDRLSVPVFGWWSEKKETGGAAKESQEPEGSSHFQGGKRKRPDQRGKHGEQRGGH